MPPGGQLPSFPPHLVATGQPPWIGAKKRGNPQKTARKAPDKPGPISYIMLTKKRVRPGPGPDSPVHPELGDARSSAPTAPRHPEEALSFVGGLTRVQFGELVVDELLEQMWVCTDHPPAVNENGRCTVDFEVLAVGVAGVDCGGGVRAGHAALEGGCVQPGLSRVVGHFGPGVFRGDDLLVVVDEVVHSPEGLGLLLVRAAPGDGCGSGPGMELFEGKVLEDDP